MSYFEFMEKVPVQEAVRAVAVHPDLPEQLKDIEELIGFDATMKLVEHWGGVVLYIPESVREDHPLRQKLGDKAVEALTRIYGRDTIDVPKAHIYQTVRRQIEVAREHRDGMSIEKLARKHGVTMRAIYKMIEREKLRQAKIRYEQHMQRSHAV